MFSLFFCLAVLLGAVELKWSWECLGECRGPETHTKPWVLRGMLLLWWHVGPVGYLNILFCKHLSFELHSERLVTNVPSRTLLMLIHAYVYETVFSFYLFFIQLQVFASESNGFQQCEWFLLFCSPALFVNFVYLVILCCHFTILAERTKNTMEQSSFLSFSSFLWR